MKFKLTKASDWGFEDSVEISSLEELKALQKKHEKNYNPTDGTWCRPSLVIDFNEMEITVYDNYME